MCSFSSYGALLNMVTYAAWPDVLGTSRGRPRTALPLPSFLRVLYAYWFNGSGVDR
jgi:hypothetical protein